MAAGAHLFYGVQGQKLGIVVAGYQYSCSSRDHSAAIAEHSRGSRARVTGRVRVSARCDFLLSAGVAQLPVYTSCLLRELLLPQMPGLAGVELRFKLQARLGAFCGAIGRLAQEAADRCQEGNVSSSAAAAASDRALRANASSSAAAAAPPRALRAIDGNTRTRPPTTDLDSTAAPLKRVCAEAATTPTTPLSQQQLSADLLTRPLHLFAELSTTPCPMPQERAATESLLRDAQMALKRCNDRLNC